MWGWVVSGRASNKDLQRFHNHGEGPYWLKVGVWGVLWWLNVVMCELCDTVIRHLIFTRSRVYSIVTYLDTWGWADCRTFENMMTNVVRCRLKKLNVEVITILQSIFLLTLYWKFASFFECALKYGKFSFDMDKCKIWNSNFNVQSKDNLSENLHLIDFCILFDSIATCMNDSIINGSM